MVPISVERGGDDMNGEERRSTQLYFFETTREDGTTVAVWPTEDGDYYGGPRYDGKIVSYKQTCDLSSARYRQAVEAARAVATENGMRLRNRGRTMGLGTTSGDPNDLR